MDKVAKNLSLLQLIPRSSFDQLAKDWQIDKGVRHLNAFKLVSILIWGFVFQRSSLREAEESFHLAKSTFADALSKRPVGFFEDLFSLVLRELLSTAQNRKDRRALREIMAIDSTACNVHGSLWGFKSWRSEFKKAQVKLHIVWNVGQGWIEDLRITGKRRSDLTTAKRFQILPGKLYVFDRAYYDLGFWLSIKKAGSHFVTRIKKQGKRLQYIHKSLGENLLKNGVIHDGIWQPGEDACYRKGIKFKDIQFRHVIYRDPISGKLFDFITSDFYMSAQEVADTYKKRWGVELLFKWLKGHLNIRRVAMKNKNAVRIQLITAAIVQLLLRLRIETEKLSTNPWQLLRKLRCSLERRLFEIGFQQAFQTENNLSALLDRHFTPPGS